MTECRLCGDLNRLGVSQVWLRVGATTPRGTLRRPLTLEKTSGFVAKLPR